MHPAVGERLARDCNLESARPADLAKRRRLVWDVEKKLAEDAARAIISQAVACAQPYLKVCVCSTIPQ